MAKRWPIDREVILKRSSRIWRNRLARNSNKCAHTFALLITCIQNRILAQYLFLYRWPSSSFQDGAYERVSRCAQCNLYGRKAWQATGLAEIILESHSHISQRHDETWLHWGIWTNWWPQKCEDCCQSDWQMEQVWNSESQVRRFQKRLPSRQFGFIVTQHLVVPWTTRRSEGNVLEARFFDSF